MNADDFRYLFNYHFSENRKLWYEHIAQLPQEQFVQNVAYSRGSLRDQILHLMNVDNAWFCELQGGFPLDELDPAAADDRNAIRSRWDGIEQNMRAYLSGLQDGMVSEKPIQEPEEDKNLMVWQVLLHVVNHGTDHRAQVLRVLHDLGVKTSSQDFIFYVYDQGSA